MYLEFFALKEKPFSLTPDPRFLFLSESHRQALDHMIYGIEEREGFILIVGDIGTGKTTICRELLEKLDRNAASALILNPLLSEQELLEAILGDFGIQPGGEILPGGEEKEVGLIFENLDPETQSALELNPLMPGKKVLENILRKVDQPPQSLTKKELIDRLNSYLLKKVEEGGNAVLIIDEAQNLAPAVLEQIRILSNLETTKQKLLQIILVGQLELKNKLEQPALRQLNQRISIRYQLKPLSFEETKRYVEHRLFVAGSNSSVAFTDEAYGGIYEYSRGVPRLVNLIAERCLLGAYVDQVRKVDLKLVERCRASLDGNLSEEEIARTAGMKSEIRTAESAEPEVKKEAQKEIETGRPPREAVSQPWERGQPGWFSRLIKRVAGLSLAVKVFFAAFLVAGVVLLIFGYRLMDTGTVGPVEKGARVGGEAQPAKITAAVRLAYSVQLGTFQNQEDAQEQVRLLNEQGLDNSVYIVPLHLVQMGGRLYRLFYGGFPTSDAAREEMDRMIDRGIIKAGSARIVETPLAFNLGDYAGLEAAAEKQDICMKRWRIPTYIFLLEPRENSSVYRLYAGAFRESEQSSFLADRLGEAGLRKDLVERLGHWPPK